jgi:hypothetical protein
MKNRLFFTVFLSFVWLCTRAQGETTIGIKAGFTSANVFGPDLSQLSTGGNPSPLSGFHAGLFVNSKVSKHFWIKSEVLTIKKGAVIKINDSYSPLYNSKFIGQYIDVYPMSPTFHYKGFQVLAGPYVSMLLSASVQKDSLGVVYTNNAIFGSSTVNSHYRQKLDAGLVAGAEYETKWGISLGFRFTQGYVPLIENAAAVLPVNTPEKPQQKVYNKSLSISIGYSFGKHKTDPPAKKK